MSANFEGFTGRRVTPSVSHRPWVPVVEASEATDALAVPVPTTALPAAAVPIAQFPVARVIIGGTDAADQTVNYQVILWSRTVPGTTSPSETYIPVKVAEGVATLGTATQNSRFLADTITQTITDYGVQAHSPADNTVAFLEIDVRNAAWLEVEVDRGTAATADIFVQLGESSGEVAVNVEANIGNVGLLDTTEAEINPAKEDGNLATLAGSTLTFARVPIDLAGTVWKDMATAGGATYARLHALVLTFSAAGTYRICSDDDGAGTNAVDLAGSTMYAGANGGIVVPFKAQKDACLVTPVSKHLSLYTSVAADGYAIVSVGA